MPEMGGRQCLEQLLRIDPKAKILITTGYDADARGKSPVETGAKGFVSKPFEMGQMLQAVREVLDSDT